MALRRLRALGHGPVALLSTYQEDTGRVAMHGTRESLLRAQAAALGLPIYSGGLPGGASNEEYEQRMRRLCGELIANGIEAAAFGDLFLSDVREYRESRMREAGMTPYFPLWHKDTLELAHEIIDTGTVAIVSGVDSEQLSPEFRAPISVSQGKTSILWGRFHTIDLIP